MKKERLFIYGTLIDPDVQIRVFGRTTSGSREILENYALSSITLLEDAELLSHGTYPMIIPNMGSEVVGFVIEVTPLELNQIDIYETEAYERACVKVKSGLKVWVYRQPINP